MKQYMECCVSKNTISEFGVLEMLVYNVCNICFQ